MAISKKVQSFLHKMGVDPEIVQHKTVYTVYDLAQTLREKFERIAKTLLVKADKEYFLVVMPANYRLDMQKFKKAVKAKKVTLASEKDMKNKFNTKPGAMLPFGVLHKVDVVMDKSLLKTKDALFHVGSFTESLRMKIKDYVRVAEPQIISVAQKVSLKLHVVTKKPKKKKRVVRKKVVRKKKRSTTPKRKGNRKK